MWHKFTYWSIVPYLIFYPLQEIAKLRNKSHSSVSVYSSYDSELLDSRLDIALDDLRGKSEDDIADFKAQIDAVYKNKVWMWGS